MTNPQQPTIEQLADAAHKLREAEAAHEDAKREASAASSRETSARNALNDAQKEFDKIVTTMKDNAPAGSNWFQAKIGRRCEVENTFIENLAKKRK